MTGLLPSCKDDVVNTSTYQVKPDAVAVFMSLFPSPEPHGKYGSGFVYAYMEASARGVCNDVVMDSMIYRVRRIVNYTTTYGVTDVWCLSTPCAPCQYVEVFVSHSGDVAVDEITATQYCMRYQRNM